MKWPVASLRVGSFCFDCGLAARKSNHLHAAKFSCSEMNKLIDETDHNYKNRMFKEALRTGFYEFQVRQPDCKSPTFGAVWYVHNEHLLWSSLIGWLIGLRVMHRPLETSTGKWRLRGCTATSCGSSWRRRLSCCARSVHISQSTSGAFLARCVFQEAENQPSSHFLNHDSQRVWLT